MEEYLVKIMKDMLFWDFKMPFGIDLCLSSFIESCVVLYVWLEMIGMFNVMNISYLPPFGWLHLTLLSYCGSCFGHYFFNSLNFLWNFLWNFLDTIFDCITPFANQICTDTGWDCSIDIPFKKFLHREWSTITWTIPPPEHSTRILTRMFKQP